MPELDYLNDKEEVNMEALCPWSLALRHLYLYFEGERMDPRTSLCPLGINAPFLNNSGTAPVNHIV